MESVEQEQSTLASRVRQLGGGGLPAPALDLFEQRELQHRKVRADTSRTDAYRQSEFARIDDDMDAKLHEARDRDVASALRPLEQQLGRLMAEIKGTSTRDLSETSDAQRERLGRQNFDAVSLNSDLTVIQAMRDPVDLQNIFGEAMLAERSERLRKLAPVIAERLERLARARVPGADTASLTVRVEWQTWKQKNPPAIERLRRVKAEIAAVPSAIEGNYIRARQHFQFRRHAHGR